MGPLFKAFYNIAQHYSVPGMVQNLLPLAEELMSAWLRILWTVDHLRITWFETLGWSQQGCKIHTVNIFPSLIQILWQTYFEFRIVVMQGWQKLWTKYFLVKYWVVGQLLEMSTGSRTMDPSQRSQDQAQRAKKQGRLRAADQGPKTKDPGSRREGQETRKIEDCRSRTMDGKQALDEGLL